MFTNFLSRPTMSVAGRFDIPRTLFQSAKRSTWTAGSQRIQTALRSTTPVPQYTAYSICLSSIFALELPPSWPVVVFTPVADTRTPPPSDATPSSPSRNLSGFLAEETTCSTANFTKTSCSLRGRCRRRTLRYHATFASKVRYYYIRSPVSDS